MKILILGDGPESTGGESTQGLLGAGHEVTLDRAERVLIGGLRGQFDLLLVSTRTPTGHNEIMPGVVAGIIACANDKARIKVGIVTHRAGPILLEDGPQDKIVRGLQGGGHKIRLFEARSVAAPAPSGTGILCYLWEGPEAVLCVVDDPAKLDNTDQFPITRLDRGNLPDGKPVCSVVSTQVRPVVHWEKVIDLLTEGDAATS